MVHSPPSAITMAEDNAVVIPEDVSSYWKSLDPAVRAALIASSSAADPSTSNGGAVAVAGAQGQPMTSCSKQDIMMATSAPTAPSTDEPCSNKRARVSLDNDEKEQQEDTSSLASDMSLLPPGSTISPTWTKSDWVVAWNTTKSAYSEALRNNESRTPDDNKSYRRH